MPKTVKCVLINVDVVLITEIINKIGRAHV